MTQVSYQLYSSRHFGPMDETLSMLARAGYGLVEGYGALFGGLGDLNEFAAKLRSNQLHMATAHVGLDMLEADPGQVLTIAETLGLEAALVPFLAETERPSDAAGWRDFGRRLERAGAPLRDAGLGFGWHNHAFEFEPLADGSFPMEQILAGGPNLAFEFDVAWCVRAGADPFAVIERFGDRILAAHVKDIAAEGENADEDGWADVGLGVMDWPALMAALTGVGCRYFVMEHDNPSDDKRFATTSFDFISRL